MRGFGAISFSGDTKAGPFYEQIHSGRKTLTLRAQRKDGRPHVKVEHSFSMYWKVRDNREKPIHYIGRAECVAYEPVKIVDHWNDEEFAKSDGFADLEEFRDNWYPGWRWAPVLDDVVKAYEFLKEEEYTVDEIIVHSGRALGKNTLMAFLQLEYMMIQWKFPLIEVGE